MTKPSNYWIVEINGTNEAMCHDLPTAEQFIRENQKPDDTRTFRIKPTQKIRHKKGAK